MKLKQLESMLQDVEPFEVPKIELEQYPTTAHLASHFLFEVENRFGELDGCSVLDLGCGTAMLSIGAVIMGAAHVVAIDVDEDALTVAQRNVSQWEDDMPIDFVRSDVRQVAGQGRLRAETVLMNPPFGTRRKGADVEFLEAAFQLSSNSIYSLHKTSTRSHIEKVARRLNAASADVIAQLRYDLPASYKFHKEKSKDIEVDIWRFEVNSD
uniref:Methyltransferase small domain-containing protein n=1 Tax=Tetraselmis chuii TaxID=63592 RepID=A0A7S1SMY4_9CHLO|mmetsp:Transcript_20647/g.36832  ORF Transcript_20647/g.36832 Transcript_20647/m.36832 type:complete len:211 (+) Transcript_20647:243-875(+)